MMDEMLLLQYAEMDGDWEEPDMEIQERRMVQKAKKRRSLARKRAQAIKDEYFPGDIDIQEDIYDDIPDYTDGPGAEHEAAQMVA